MEYPTHWATLAKCNLCGDIPESAPLFHCSMQHHYCVNCFCKLRKNYRGTLAGAATCVVCKASEVFKESNIRTDFLNKIKTKPGIGRPYRYNTNLTNKGCNNAKTNNEDTTTLTQQKPPANPKGKVTIENLFQLPPAEIRKILNRRNDSPRPSDSLTRLEGNGDKTEKNGTKKPIKCPHNPCNKMVTLSSFVTHFKHEHPDIPRYNIERGKELCLPCNPSIIEHNLSHCIAMINVYEINKIDVNKSKSSQSVINTCSKFCQQVPINSFWLMVTGSAERRPHCSYAFYWLFSISDENYQSTIELSSKKDSITLSTFCGTNKSESDGFNRVAENLNCLIVCKSSFGAILKEGPDVNLRVTVH